MSLALFALCSAAAIAQSPDSIRSDPPALTIDGETVGWERFGAWLVREHGEQHLEAFANQRVVARAAAEAGVSVPPDAVEARVQSEVDARVGNAFRGDLDAWRRELEAIGSSEEQWRARRAAELEHELLLEHWLRAERTVGMDDVRALWEERYGLGGRGVLVRALRLRYSVPSPEGTVDGDERLRREEAVRDALVARLEALRERVDAGEDFVALARAEGDDLEAAEGTGAWAEPLRWEPWPASVRAALASAPVGSVSPPLYGRGHYQLFQIVGERIVPLDEVAFALAEELRTRPLDGSEARVALGRLRAEAPLEPLPALLEDSTDPDEPVLRLGGQAVTREEYARWLAPLIAERTARRFVEVHVCEREATRAGVEVSEAGVEARVDQRIDELVHRAHRGDYEAWRAELAIRGMSEQRLRRALALRARVDLRAEELVVAARDVGDEALRALYLARFGEDGRRLDLRVLRRDLVLPPEPLRLTPEEREAQRREAVEAASRELEALRERALTRGDDFGGLAERESDDAESASRGGRYAGEFPWDRFPAEVRAHVRAMRPAEITPPIEIGDAVWLFELVRAEAVTLEEVRDELRTELAGRAATPLEATQLVDELVRRSRWTLHPLDEPR